MPPVTPVWVRGVSLRHPDPVPWGSRRGGGLRGRHTVAPGAVWQSRQGHGGQRAAPVRHHVYEDLEELS